MTAILPLVLVLGIEPPAATPAGEPVGEPSAEETQPSEEANGEAEAAKLEPVEAGEIEVVTEEERAEKDRKAKKAGATGMPDAFATDDYGPFFEKEPASEVTRPAPKKTHPPLSVGKGVFCFVDNSTCKVSLIADSDVGVGVNIITTDRGRDVPYTQFRTRFGLVMRPMALKRSKPWHPWGIGVVGSWSLGSATIASSGETDEGFDDVSELEPIDAWRVGVVNQLWLSQKRHSFHLDFTLGGVNSPVLAAPGRYWGTTVELSGTWGGWGGLVASADFLDGDTRIVMGARVHDIAAGPIIGLVILGLLIGGAL